MLMEEQEFSELFALIESFNNQYEIELSNAPYDLRLLDICRPNENAHTQILLQILQYGNCKEYPFLKSLLHEWFNKELEFDYRKIKILFNKHFIDGLILDGKSAVVVENKIHYARDQFEQIKGYVEKINTEYHIEKNNIYVVYLTRYGDKKVSDNSCPEDLKKELGAFVESNYYYDIIPWLKEDVLPNCKTKDVALIASLKLYIEHLNEICGQGRPNPMDENLRKWLNEKLGMQYGWTKDGFQKLLEMSVAMQRMNDEVEKIKREPHDSFRKITTDFWRDYFKVSEDPIIEDRLYGSDPYMIIGLRKWNDGARMIHLEWKMVEEAFFNERKFPLWLHIEPKARPIDKFRDELNKDDEFKRLIAETGMQFENRRKQYKTNISLDIEFAFMDNENRKEFLYATYEKYAPLLDYVYEKCEEVYNGD